MTLDHATLRQLAAGAALDDLDTDERDALTRHLATCARCRRLRDELDEIVADLALTAPTLRAPASLWAEVLAAVRATPRDI